jgi:hypothetical protein
MVEHGKRATSLVLQALSGVMRCAYYTLQADLSHGPMLWLNDPNVNTLDMH